MYFSHAKKATNVSYKMNANGKFGARNSRDRKVWKILNAKWDLQKKTDGERNGKKLEKLE